MYLILAWCHVALFHACIQGLPIAFAASCRRSRAFEHRSIHAYLIGGHLDINEVWAGLSYDPVRSCLFTT